MEQSKQQNEIDPIIRDIRNLHKSSHQQAKIFEPHINQVLNSQMQDLIKSNQPSNIDDALKNN